MVDPLFWLGLSLLLVAVSLTAVFVAALPALQELARAARSLEKLCDTLNRELPPTLESIRLTGMEISDLTDDVSESVQSAGRVVKQVDQSVSSVKRQARQAQVTTRSVWTGAKAAWKTLMRSGSSTKRRAERLPSGKGAAMNLPDNYQDSYQDGYAAYGSGTRSRRDRANGSDSLLPAQAAGDSADIAAASPSYPQRLREEEEAARSGIRSPAPDTVAADEEAYDTDDLYVEDA